MGGAITLAVFTQKATLSLETNQAILAWVINVTILNGYRLYYVGGDINCLA